MEGDSDHKEEQQTHEQDGHGSSEPQPVYEITQTDEVNAKLLQNFVTQLEQDPDRFFLCANT
jgi:hypothetical protein